LVVCLVLAVLAGAGVIYLAYFVDANPREMSVTVPPAKLGP
jgi:hypothetical protein